ncbi:hypothetical protein [Salimicrobium halophilum]|uniref:Bh protein n=1 Tax=Salimicrobium halophilum TaxID=86666 RepID=A0A1G8URP0_9BACI|nr:hypothetical protein [Salimicrobium halophilum]SDJ56458.1 hypothetical protein SAMN04490247_2355 [Salimicrobium halophilum]
MIINEVEADLYCINCHEESPHEIIYVRDKISHIRCLECDRTMEFQTDILHEYGKHMYYNLANKPKQFNEEYRKHLSSFLFGLPVRIVSKPYRFAKEFHKDFQDIQRYKNKIHHKEEDDE